MNPGKFSHFLFLIFFGLSLHCFGAFPIPAKHEIDCDDLFNFNQVSAPVIEHRIIFPRLNFQKDIAHNRSSKSNYSILSAIFGISGDMLMVVALAGEFANFSVLSTLFVLSGIGLGIAALVLGYTAFHRKQRLRGLALSGMILGGLTFMGAFFAIIIAIMGG